MKWKYIEPLAEIYQSYIEDLKIEVHERLLAQKEAGVVQTALLSFLLFPAACEIYLFELDQLFEIGCVVPVSTVFCERSFNTIKIIKNYMKSRMTDPSQKNLMLIGM